MLVVQVQVDGKGAPRTTEALVVVFRSRTLAPTIILAVDRHKAGPVRWEDPVAVWRRKALHLGFFNNR